MWSRLWTSGGQSICNVASRTTRAGDSTGIVHFGGYGSLAYQASSSAAKDTPASRGYVEAFLDTGVLWGNATHRANITTAIDACQSSGWFPSGQVHLFGGSAGGLTVLQWALANPSRVKSIYLTIPLTDLQSGYDRDVLGLASSISDAYGGRPPDAENPQLRADELIDIPMEIAYSSDDPVCLAAETEAFIEAAGASAVNMGAVGHNWNSALHNGRTVAAFFAENE